MPDDPTPEPEIDIHAAARQSLATKTCDAVTAIVQALWKLQEVEMQLASHGTFTDADATGLYTHASAAAMDAIVGVVIPALVADAKTSQGGQPTAYDLFLSVMLPR